MNDINVLLSLKNIYDDLFEQEKKLPILLWNTQMK